MSQRSATVLGVYNGTLYVERSVVSTANSYVLKSAYSKAYGKATAKRMAKPRQSVWQSHGKAYGKIWADKLRFYYGKVPKTLRTLILKTCIAKCFATWVYVQAYRCIRRHYGRFGLGLKGSVKLRYGFD